MTELSKEEKFIRHAPCENCGSRDNLAIYSGHTYCFGCQQYKKTNGELPDKIIPKKEIKGMITGITEALPKRKINSETANYLIMKLVLIIIRDATYLITIIKTIKK